MLPKSIRQATAFWKEHEETHRNNGAIDDIYVYFQAKLSSNLTGRRLVQGRLTFDDERQARVAGFQN